MKILSPLKFLIEVTVIFVFIKFLLFPIVGYALGVKEPITAVISGSMEHPTDWEGGYWKPYSQSYTKFNITEDEFNQFPFHDGVKTGDVLVLHKKEIEIGDVIVYKISNSKYLAHRVMSLNPIQTKGDANQYQLPNGVESNISQDKIIGTAWIRIPYLGYLKVYILELLSYIK